MDFCDDRGIDFFGLAGNPVLIRAVDIAADDNPHASGIDLRATRKTGSVGVPSGIRVFLPALRQGNGGLS
jgi:hypothetical protein